MKWRCVLACTCDKRSYWSYHPVQDHIIAFYYCLVSFNELQREGHLDHLKRTTMDFRAMATVFGSMRGW